MSLLPGDPWNVRIGLAEASPLESKHKFRPSAVSKLNVSVISDSR
jgi:hypothetical protein